MDYYGCFLTLWCRFGGGKKIMVCRSHPICSRKVGIIAYPDLNDCLSNICVPKKAVVLLL